MTKLDLRTKTTIELAELLRTLSVEEWNMAQGEARRAPGYWRAALSGAALSGAYLSGAYLKGANLTRANLSGANLTGAMIGGVALTGRVLQVAPVAGYHVTVFGADNEAGHLVRAGCWTGVLDGALDRLREEADGDETPECIAEVEAFVKYASSIVDAWKAVKS